MKQDGHSEKIKSLLIRKIQERAAVEEKIADIEDQSKPEQLDQLIDEGGEYSELLAEILDLDNNIDKLLIETVYWPLVGLSGLDKKRIDISSISHGVGHDANLEKYFELDLLNFKDGMVRRFNKLKALHLIRESESRIAMLYKEIARCYVHGLFVASTALSRSLVESVAEGYCMQSIEFKEKFRAAKNSIKSGLAADFLEQKIPQEIFDIYKLIRDAGNNVLHSSYYKPDEEAALKTIELSYKFINWIYKTPDYSAQVKEV